MIFSFNFLGALRASALKIVADQLQADPRLAALKPDDPSKVTEMRLRCLLFQPVTGVKECLHDSKFSEGVKG